MGYQRIENSVFTQELFNDNLDALELFHANCSGRGVLWGMDLSDGGGFDVDIAAGAYLTGKMAQEYAGGTHTCAPSTTEYIWIDEDGATTATGTTTDPGGTWTPLGAVITDGSGVVSVLLTGRIDLPRFEDIHTYKIGETALVADLLQGRIGVGKAPSSALDVAGQANFEDVAIDGIAVGAAVLAAANLRAYYAFGGL